MNLKDFLEQSRANPPYFVEGLKRKSIVSTETCMHIHNSIMTFRQYLRSTQLLKSKAIDPRIPAEREGMKLAI